MATNPGSASLLQDQDNSDSYSPFAAFREPLTPESDESYQPPPATALPPHPVFLIGAYGGLPLPVNAASVFPADFLQHQLLTYPPRSGPSPSAAASQLDNPQDPSRDADLGDRLPTAMASDVSPTRLYLGNLAKNATKADVEQHFSSHPGEIVEIKLMNGFGFIEYKDPMDARDVVPAFHGTTLLGERLVVQFARGSRRNEEMTREQRPAPRPRRTPYRMQITGLPVETSWQDLKDFARQSGTDVVYSEVSRDRDGGKGFVEFETAADMNSAVTKLNNTEFKGQTVRCTADQQDERPREGRYRSRSPRRGYYPPGPPGYYDEYRRRDYSPPREYRRRTPPPRDYYEQRDRYGPPPSRPMRPVDDRYGAVRGYADDGYGPPRRSAPYDPYMNGYGSRPYAGPPSPRRPSPAHNGYPPDYDRAPRW